MIRLTMVRHSLLTVGVEIPDEIAQRTAAGGGGGALIDRLKQQMQRGGK